MLGKIEAGGEGGDRGGDGWWHHQLNGHEFEQIQGDSEGQGSLACCSYWGLKESDMTEQLNNSKLCSATLSQQNYSNIVVLPLLMPESPKHLVLGMIVSNHGGEREKRRTITRRKQKQ